ncbi:hypothetical protein HK105_208073 [Polyrhizophydium stewartii]|uniref:Uncharacterized protein n=1 Tax=Polyrhizophydium stewartii TaxID=2732419 RepID=A0ABR4MYV0_9FUNG
MHASGATPLVRLLLRETADSVVLATDERPGCYYAVSLRLLRRFPDSLLMAMFPRGIPPAAILDLAELDADTPDRRSSQMRLHPHASTSTLKRFVALSSAWQTRFGDLDLVDGPAGPAQDPSAPAAAAAASLDPLDPQSVLAPETPLADTDGLGMSNESIIAHLESVHHQQQLADRSADEPDPLALELAAQSFSSDPTSQYSESVDDTIWRSIDELLEFLDLESLFMLADRPVPRVGTALLESKALRVFHDFEVVMFFADYFATPAHLAAAFVEDAVATSPVLAAAAAGSSASLAGRGLTAHVAQATAW